MTDRVHLGTPISSTQAARAVLNLIDTPVVQFSETELRDPGLMLQRLMTSGINAMLSSGEKHLRDMARSLWNGKGADLADLGAIDHTNRRKVLVICWYYFLGQSNLSDIEMALPDWQAVFGTDR